LGFIMAEFLCMSPRNARDQRPAGAGFTGFLWALLSVADRDLPRFVVLEEGIVPRFLTLTCGALPQLPGFAKNTR
jgi:hypothetical protein